MAMCCADGVASGAAAVLPRPIANAADQRGPSSTCTKLQRPAPTACQSLSHGPLHVCELVFRAMERAGGNGLMTDYPPESQKFQCAVSVITQKRQSEANNVTSTSVSVRVKDWGSCFGDPEI